MSAQLTSEERRGEEDDDDSIRQGVLRVERELEVAKKKAELIKAKKAKKEAKKAMKRANKSPLSLRNLLHHQAKNEEEPPTPSG